MGVIYPFMPNYKTFTDNLLTLKKEVIAPKWQPRGVKGQFEISACHMVTFFHNPSNSPLQVGMHIQVSGGT